MSSGYKFQNEEAAYFGSFAAVEKPENCVHGSTHCNESDKEVLIELAPI